MQSRDSLRSLSRKMVKATCIFTCRALTASAAFSEEEYWQKVHTYVESNTSVESKHSLIVAYARRMWD